MARDNGSPRQMFLLVTDENQSASVQINSEGHAKLLEPSDPIHSKDRGGNGVTFYNEKGDVENGVLLTDYHFFVNENNEVFTVPPGAIVQGRFKAKKSPEKLKEESAVEENHDEITPDTSGLQSNLNDSIEMEFAPMEDIELEEEIVSNSEPRDVHKSVLSLKDQTKPDGIKHSGDKQRNGTSSRHRKKKKTLLKPPAASNEDGNKNKGKNKNTINHNNLIDQLAEKAETQQHDANLVETPCTESHVRDDSNNNDRSSSTENTICDPNSHKEQSNKLTHKGDALPPSSDILNDRAVHQHFINDLLIEIIDRAVEDTSRNSSQDVHVVCQSSSDKRVAVATKLSYVQTNDDIIKNSQHNVEEDIMSADSKVSGEETMEFDKSDAQLPNDLNENSLMPEEAPPTDIVGLNDNSIQVPHTSTESKAMHSNVINNLEKKDSCGLNDENSSLPDITLDSNSSVVKDFTVMSHSPKMVDKDVQVLLSNFKVIRVSNDWSMPRNTKKTEFLTRDVINQKKELEEFSSKLKAMEKEFEVRMSYFKREKSLFEMKKRSFDVEMAKERQAISRAKEEIGLARISLQNTPRQAANERKAADKIFTQNTYVGSRERKRKSEAPLARVSKVPRRASSARGSKNSN